MTSKDPIRRRLRSLRDALSESEVEARSLLIQERFLRSPLLHRADTIALYAPIRNEVRTGGIFEAVVQRGKRALFPRCEGDRLEFVEVRRGRDLSKGSWGILEPARGPTVPLDQVDLILVPGIAFDREGYRVGFGRGFYDRTVAALNAVRVALAYDFQVVEAIPVGLGDLRCEALMTEGETLDTGVRLQ